MLVQFLDILTGEILEEWEYVDFIPTMDDGIIIKDKIYSVISRIWLGNGNVALNVEKIPGDNP